MERQVEMVKAFHTKFGHEVNHRPKFPEVTTQQLRIRLVNEEADELEHAILTNNLVEIADALADLLYVTLGTAIAYGINIIPIFAEVHRTNMLKSTSKDDYGKSIKPANWKGPQILPILWEQSKMSPQEFEQIELLFNDETERA